MKQRKQRMIALLIFSLLIIGVNYSGSWIKAADNPQIYAETISVSAGDEISIPVLVRDNPGIMGIAITVTYDQNVLAPVKVERGKLLTGLEGQFGDTISVSTDNSFETVWAGVDNFTGDGELYIMTFQVADRVNVTSTSITLSYTESDTFDESFTEIALDCQDVSIIVGNTEDVLSFNVSIGYASTDFTESTFDVTKNNVTIKGDGYYAVSYTATKSTSDIHVLGLDTNLHVDNVPQGMTITATKLTVGNQEYTLGTCDVTNDENRNYRLGIRNPYDGAVSNRALGNTIVPVTAGDTITIYFTVSGTGVQNPDAQTQTIPQVSTAPGDSTSTTPQQSPSASPSSTTKNDTTSQPTTSTKVKEVSKPGKTKLKSCKSKKKGVITVKWKKVSKADGYQVQCSTKRNFVKKKIYYVYGKSASWYAKSKKTYYVRIRAYRYGNIKYRVYSKWSKVKKVRVK